MKTSATILKARYQPLQGTHKGDRWTFASESRARVLYTVEREGKAYRCGCPARGLCKHVVAAVLDDARPRWERVQVFTDEADARRQRNRRVEFTANGWSFWVVYARRRLSLDNPDVAGVTFGSISMQSSEVVFRGGESVVVEDGGALLAEAARRGWGGSRGSHVWWNPNKER